LPGKRGGREEKGEGKRESKREKVYHNMETHVSVLRGSVCKILDEKKHRINHLL
jgi:hypothetical protein